MSGKTNPAAIDKTIDRLRARKAKARGELDAVNAELGRVFAEVIANELDLKAKAKRAGVSRTTAYKLAERVGAAGSS